MRAQAPPDARSIRYGQVEIVYALYRSDRSTVGVTVQPDLTVRVTAPADASAADVDQLVKRRAAWILAQQQELEQYLPTLPPRQYVSGETHLYLGKQYRLKVEDGAPASVKLTRGRFFVVTQDRRDRDTVKRLLDDWYRRQARRVFAALLEEGLQRAQAVGVKVRPTLRIRRMEKRWGSCTDDGTITLNLKLIQAPKPLIAYVIMHELCHLQEHHHGAAFYALLDRAMPDWRERRERLNLVRVG